MITTGLTISVIIAMLAVKVVGGVVDVVVHVVKVRISNRKEA